MQHFLQLAQGLNVAPLLAALAAQPHLFDAFPYRTCAPDSPHQAVSDIWVRYNDPANFGPSFNDEHDAVWYPAYAALPALQALLFDLMHLVGGERLGGVLITRLPAGAEIAPHVDAGWHASYYDKFYIALQNAPGAVFRFPDGEIHAKPGDCYWFDNSVPHSVHNDSGQERLALIVCIRSAAFSTFKQEQGKIPTKNQMTKQEASHV